MAFFGHFIVKNGLFFVFFSQIKGVYVQIYSWPRLFFTFLETRIGQKSSLFPLLFCLFFEITPVYLQNKSKKIVNDGIKKSKNSQKLDIPGWSWFWICFSTNRGDLEKKTKSIIETWNGEKIINMRMIHKNQGRSPIPICKGCSKIGVEYKY